MHHIPVAEFWRIFYNILNNTEMGFYMNKIDITQFSDRHTVRKLTPDNIEIIYTLCKENPQFYEYSGRELSRDLIKQDLEVTPPGIPSEQKYFVGFFDDDKLVAVMDLIDGYPTQDHGYIGFFMVKHKLQQAGVGTDIISKTLEYLKQNGFKYCRLGIDKSNPQSNHFWKKNGFTTIKEVSTEDGIILVAEKQL